MIRTVQITAIEFDCSLEESVIDDWTEKDQLETEETLLRAYLGQVFELEVSDDADDDEIVDELLEEVSSASGWCIRSIDYRHVLK